MTSQQPVEDTQSPPFDAAAGTADEVEADTEVEGGSSAGADEPQLQPGLSEAAADSKILELTADLQRLQAEYLNYKRRVDRDRDLVLQNAKFAILSALLPVLDDVDRARQHGELSGGFKAVAEALERVVLGEGLVKFGAPGDEFDPHLHEAIMHALSADALTTTCDTIVQAGYQIGDRVVRPALVTVVDPDPSAASSDVAGGGPPVVDFETPRPSAPQSKDEGDEGARLETTPTPENE